MPRLTPVWFVLLAVTTLHLRAAEVPDPVVTTLKVIHEQPVVANWPVFFGPTFPKIDFLNPGLVTAAFGSYELKIRFFDAKWNEVTTPATAGRYGAIVTARFANGAVETRNLTLYHVPGKYVPALDPYRVVVTLPQNLGLPAGINEQERWMISDFVGRGLDDVYNPHRNNANLIAALADVAADPARWHGHGYREINGEWWLTLQEKLGTAQDYERIVGLPEDYDKKPDAKWPLIIYLFGSGIRHGDLATLKNEGPLAYMNKGHLPFIVAVPMCPDEERWQPRKLAKLLDRLEKEYRIDPKRVYVTGVSLGGYGTLDFAGAYPERIAAIAPVAGGANPEIAQRLGKMPAWIFHGGEDSAVPARYSLDVAEAMKRAGAPVVLSYYKDWGHGGWTGSRWGKVPYEEPELYAWFLTYSRP